MHGRVLLEGTRVRVGDLAGSVFAADLARGARGVAINLPGLPSRIHATPLVPLLLETGYSVFQPQYYGTYDSAGRFDPYVAYRTVLDAVEVIRTGKVHEF